MERAADGSRILLPGIVECIAGFMHRNEVPCDLLLVNKATAAALRGRQEYTTVWLSQPVPQHAFARRWGAPGATRSLNLSQRYQLVRLTAVSGSTPNLEVAIEAVGGLLVADQAGTLTAAARAGKVDVCRWLLERCFALTTEAAEEAAKAGRREAVEFLLANGVAWDWCIVHAAARGGHPTSVDWLLLRRPEGAMGLADGLQGTRLFECAAEGYDLAAQQALYQLLGVNLTTPLGRPYSFSRALIAAAGSPTADWQAKVEWLEATEQAAREEAFMEGYLLPAAAACPDALQRLMWWRQRGHVMNNFAVRAAARAGNAAALEYMLSEGGQANEFTAVLAAEKGRLEVLQLLHARGCLVGPEHMLEMAALCGHLPVVAWAVEALGLALPGLPGIIAHAARSGSVELMAWLHDRGCGLGAEVFEAAAKSGCEGALEWLVLRGCPMPDGGAPYLAAVSDGADPPMLRCLRRLGCPWGPVGRVFAEAVKGGRTLPALRGLVEAGCPVDWEAALQAATREGSPCSSEVQSWLRDQLRSQRQQQQQQQQQH